MNKIKKITLATILAATTIAGAAYAWPWSNNTPKWKGKTAEQLHAQNQKRMHKADQCKTPLEKRTSQVYVQPAHLEVYNSDGTLTNDITLRAERVPVITFTDIGQYATFVPPKQRVASEISPFNDALEKQLLNNNGYRYNTITAQELVDNNISTRRLYMHYRLLDKQPGPCKTDEYTAAATFTLQLGAPSTPSTRSAPQAPAESIMRKTTMTTTTSATTTSQNETETLKEVTPKDDAIKTIGFDFGHINETIENTRKDGSSLEDGFAGMRVGMTLKRVTDNGSMMLRTSYASLNDNQAAAYDPYSQAGTLNVTSIAGFIDLGLGHHLIKPTFLLGAEYKNLDMNIRPATYNQPSASAKAGVGLVVGDKRSTYAEVTGSYVYQDQQFQQPYAPFNNARKADHAFEGGPELGAQVQKHTVFGDNALDIYAGGAVRKVKSLGSSPTRQILGTATMKAFDLGATYWHSNFFLNGQVQWNGMPFTNQDKTKVNVNMNEFAVGFGWRFK